MEPNRREEEAEEQGKRFLQGGEKGEDNNSDNSRGVSTPESQRNTVVVIVTII